MQPTKQIARAANRIAKDAKTAAYKILIPEIIHHSADVCGARWQDLMGRSRGASTAALARVVAMAACTNCGIPARATAKAFGRSRRSVRDATKYGRPGRQDRDELVQHKLEIVMDKVRRAVATKP